MSKDTGGPAFSRPFSKTGDYSDSSKEHAQEGMTLRDYFAAKAMAALVNTSRPGGWEVGPGGKDNGYIAVSAYTMADAMLAARAK